jgi:hypothetical protein
MVEINLLPSFSLFSDFVPSRKFAPSFERWHHSSDFTGVEGARGGYLIVNMDDASQLPTMAEPPAERLAYVLHDMFSVPFDQIAYGPPERHFGLRIAPK